MKKYVSPEIEAVLLNSADCITVSGNYANEDQRDSLDFLDIEWSL